MTYPTRLAAAALATTLTLACGDDGGGPDAGPPPDETLALAGLDGQVDVTIDDRGVPHIRGTTVHDVLVAEGYLMARDRFAQMEFIRRSVTGRLAEVAGGLSPGLIDDDREQRFLGFRRVGQAIYDGLPATDPTRLAADAFVAGINQYIDTVLKQPGYTTTRGNEALALILSSPHADHWTGADVFALARYQAWNLSYDAGSDVARTAARSGVATAFPAGSADPLIAARAGLYQDWWTDKPARAAFTTDGFPNVGTDTGSRARRRAAAGFVPDQRALAGAERFFDRMDANLLLRRDPHIGSNSWVVAGGKTASGHPILSNDPHLSLIAPPVWWYVHLDTATKGGEQALDVEGVAFAGLPGVVLGFNRKLAWSATTTGYDVTDVYDEQVTFRNDGTPAAPVWTPTAVRFRGADVPLQVVDEVINIQGQATPETYKVYVVPHHGALIPDSIVAPTAVADPHGRAMSVRYTGDVPTNELAFFVGLLSAGDFAAAETAQDNFRVGAQNFSFVSATDGIRWSTEARIPQRDPRACSFGYDANGAPTGISPLFVLDGASGDHEWTTDLEDRYVPHEVNPARGYIATSNQDNVGVTTDGNPCNDPYYLGGDFDTGYRQARIRQRLDALTTRGGITTDDMVALQGETTSILGEGMRAAVIASIDHALGDPSDDPALAAAMTAIGTTGRAQLMDARARLMAWSFATPHGVGATAASEIADSVATTVWNLTLTRLASLAFDDEGTRIGRRPGSLLAARALEWALTAPASMATYRAAYGGDATWNDSVLWDDLDTAAVRESRDERVVRAVIAAYGFAGGRLGTDPEQWRWGRLHQVRFGQVVPALDGNAQVSIPPAMDTTFPDGFPRHGDLGAVDPGNYGIYGTSDFHFGSGASQRLVVEMTPTGPVARNALPGGQREDPDDPHHADEAELWRVNQQPPLYFEQADIEAHAERRVRFTPGS
ncbi:MAG: penicillin acylase family protein [Myxococcales bacterium]|nr:penicillin acylase family protein [Myxococcales bacterium]MBP6842444.1 penicillin acylase family protein [Kofleriaceae bacterium]